jgi:hypothetical protein
MHCLFSPVSKLDVNYTPIHALNCCLFFCGLFNDSDSSPEYIVLKIGQLLCNVPGTVGKNGVSLRFEQCFPDIWLKALRKAVKTFRIYMFSGQGHESWTSRNEDNSVTIMSTAFDTYNKQTHKQTTNSVAFSPRANYTDRATADCRRS